MLQEDLPKASIEPDQEAVERIKNDEVRLNVSTHSDVIISVLSKHGVF